jgi:ATP-dependent Lhr-like helicase
LLIPENRRRPLNGNRRRGVNVMEIDVTGRWDLIPRGSVDETAALDSASDEMGSIIDSLLRRYGVVFKRVVERETVLLSWRYVLWALRRMAARGGRFVAGFSGEQFALPEAVETLRKIHKRNPDNEIVVVGAADPLNLVGIVTPGLRIPANINNRIAYLVGEPVAVQLGNDVRMLRNCPGDVELCVRTQLIKPASGKSTRRYHRR